MIIWLSLLLQVPQMSIPQDWHRMVSLNQVWGPVCLSPSSVNCSLCEADPHSKCVPLRWFQPFPSFLSYRFSGPNGLSLCSPLSSLSCYRDAQDLSKLDHIIQQAKEVQDRVEMNWCRHQILSSLQNFSFQGAAAFKRQGDWLFLREWLPQKMYWINQYKWNQKDDITHAHVVGGMLSACLRHRGPW